MSLSLPSGVYGSILQGFFGGVSDDTKSTLWAKFLESQGLPPDTTPPPTSTLEGQFIDFLQGAASIATEGLSPDEIARRKLFATVIQELIRLMKELQNSNVVQNALTLFYTKYQAQYTDMIAAVPIYMGRDNLNTWSPSTDPAKFTFGYNDLSITDIAAYLASKQISTNSSSFQLQTAQITAPVDSYVLRVTNASTGSPFMNVHEGDQINLQYNFTQVNGTPQVQIFLTNFSQPTQSSPYSSLLLGSFTGTTPTANTQKAWADAYTQVIQTAFQTPMESNGQQVYQFGPVFIPWRYTTEEIPGAYNNPDDFDAQRAFLSADELVQERGAVNQKLDGFIENLKSYKDTLQNNAEGVINNIQATSSSIKANVGVINSALHQLKTVLDGIFN